MVPEFVTKIIQIFDCKVARHGNMIVGKTGAGKSVAWQTLQRAMARLRKNHHESEQFQKVSNAAAAHGMQMYQLSLLITVKSDFRKADLAHTAAFTSHKHHNKSVHQWCSTVVYIPDLLSTFAKTRVDRPSVYAGSSSCHQPIGVIKQ